MIGVFVNAAPGGSSKALRLTDAFNGSWGFMGRSCQPVNPWQAGEDAPMR